MHRPESKGRAVAAVLAGAWRASPPNLEATTADLAATAPLLVESGAAALGWWRIRQSGGQRVPSGLGQLRATYLRYAVHAAEQESEIVGVFNALRSSGVKPILLKGWAIARSYPESGLRPSGDIDLYVSPEQYARAKAVLSTRPSSVYSVDLDHDTMTRFSELTFEALYLRSQLVNLDGAEIRVPGAEDHLRILCLHMLKHGAWRPLWLCDVAAALESRPQNFDWNRCLGKHGTHADWVVCTLALADQLLGAETKGTPAQGRGKTLPDWLVSSVLKQWSAPNPPNLPLFVDQVGKHWWKMETLRAIRQRWPNPIQATVDAGGSFNERSRLPFQVLDCVLRTARLCRQLPGLLRN
ncbi:MAG: nucleotidyltransferase family protein [Acidobacteriia bacterium]|nr:nucleotidyltransferase family protein [Terriglobia bacterium]